MTDGQRNKRARLVLLLALGSPVVAVAGWLWTTTAPTHAQQRTGDTRMRPVTETTYRDEIYEVTVHYNDPKTGEVKQRKEQRTRKVPVTTTRMVAETTPGSSGGYPSPVVFSYSLSHGPQMHSPEVMRIVSQLQGTPVSKANQEEVDSKLAELRELLEGEFAERHSHQAAEIAKTEKSLAEVKTLHEERGKNQSQIVQRRIDQLLGRKDPLDWDAGAPVTRQSYPSANPRISTNMDPRDNFVLYPSSESKPLSYRDPFAPKDWSQNSLALLTPPQPPMQERLPSSPSTDTKQANSSNINELFQVIVQAGQAMLAEQATQVELTMSTSMFQGGDMTQYELNKAKVAYETAKQRAAVLKLQIAAMRKEIENELALAKALEGDAAIALYSTKEKGAAQERAEAQRQVRIAEARADRAAQVLAQVDEALKQIQPSSPQAPSTDPKEANNEPFDLR